MISTSEFDVFAFNLEVFELRITKVAFPSGASFLASRLNVFIGPNNSGKTQALKDLFRKGVSQTGRCLVLEKVDFKEIANLDRDLLAAVHVGQKKTLSQQTDQIRGLSSDLRSGSEFEWHIDHFKENPRSAHQSSLPTELKVMQFGFLEGASRLELTKQVESHNPQIDPPENLLQALFVDKTGAEAKLSRAIKEAFGLEIRLDYTAMRGLCFRVALDFDGIDPDPRLAFQQMQQKPLLDSEGDGIRSYVAIVLAVLLCKDRIILIDEPEAFLHSSHQRSLGRWLSKQVNESEYQIFIATHSASFLSGLVGSGEDASIVRLSRDARGNHVNLMTSDQLKDLANSPLLSSQRILESLFHRGVVVCEADSDRIVYQAVADRCVNDHEHQFVFAHDKQTLKPVAALLQQASVPYSVIADLDMIHHETELVELVQAMSKDVDLAEIKKLRGALSEFVEAMPEHLIEANLKTDIERLASDVSNDTVAGVLRIRAALKRVLKENNNWADLKRQGIGVFSGQQALEAERLLALLASIGLFLVPVGSLESWIKLEANKQHWAPKALAEIANGRTPPALIDFVSATLAFNGLHDTSWASPIFDPSKDRMKSVRPELPRAYLS